jgi:hypothetical protein
MLAAIIFVAFLLVLMFWSGRFTAKQAAKRGRSWGVWFVLGSVSFPLFPIASIMLALLPSRRQEAVPSN